MLTYSVHTVKENGTYSIYIITIRNKNDRCSDLTKNLSLLVQPYLQDIMGFTQISPLAIYV